MVCFTRIATFSLPTILWLAYSVDGFSPTISNRWTQPTGSIGYINGGDQVPTTSLFNSGSKTTEIHPAVAGWPEKYGREVIGGTFHSGPQILSEVFAIERAASPDLLQSLDVANWPTWTTADKGERWSIGNQVADKIMPYGELSYMISGRLEIIPQSTGQAVVVEPGDLVTFPEGFVASWRVLEEVNWHYYLY